MAGTWKTIADQIGATWKGGTPTQRVLGALSALVVVLGIAGAAWLGTRPDHALLFGNLDPADAAQVVEEVRKAGVEAEVRDGGRSVYVPRAKVSEMRMLVAGAGLPRGGSSGWELFDRSDFGVSDFVQNVNYRRALEGQLSRDIESFDAVDEASVKISKPQRSAFVSQGEATKAAVLIRTRGGQRLAPENVRAVQQLVAGAVEGLALDAVTITDTTGRVLSENNQDALAESAEAQQGYARKEEELRRRRAQEMLDRLGVKADVRVALELDFQQMRETTEKYDPTGTALTEEIENKKIEGGSSSVGGPAGAASKVDGGAEAVAEAAGGETSENVKTTFGVGRTVRSQELTQPKVRRMSVSLVLHKEHEADLARWEQAVKNAVGFDPSRGDVISTMAYEFAVGEPGAEVENGGFSALLPVLLERLIQVAGVLGALLVALTIVRRIDRKSLPAKAAAVSAGPSLGAEAARAAAAEPARVRPADEVEFKVPSIHEMVRSAVESDPATATRVLRSWLRDEGSSN